MVTCDYLLINYLHYKELISNDIYRSNYQLRNQTEIPPLHRPKKWSHPAVETVESQVNYLRWT